MLSLFDIPRHRIALLIAALVACDSSQDACPIGSECSDDPCPGAACENDPANATLSALSISDGTELSPGFDPETATYVAGASTMTAAVTVTPTATAAGATIEVDGVTVGSGDASAPIQVSATEPTPITVDVTAADGVTTRRYEVVVIRDDIQYFKASNPGVLDYFGLGIAISGDTLAVSSRREASAATGIDGNQADDSAPGAGAVYVFVRNDEVWAQQAYLKASNTDTEDEFGHKLALDGNTLVVTSEYEDSAATGVDGNQSDNSAGLSGAAYVFVRTGVTWTQQAYLKASNTDSGDFFGSSVALSGDTLVVGARDERSAAPGVNANQSDDSLIAAGAAYVFVRSGSTWTQQAYLKPSNPQALVKFGTSAAIDGDTVAIGSLYEGTGATDSGAVYLFVRNGGSWSQQAMVKASSGATFDGFGHAIALSGDVLVVGAPYEDSAAIGIDGNPADDSASESGAAYVFTRAGTSWTQQAYLKASNTEAGDQFGYGVAISGRAVAVAARAEDSAARGIDGDQADNGATDSGAVYLFALDGSSWRQRAYVKPFNTRAHVGFGGGTSGFLQVSIDLSEGVLAVGATNELGGATGVNGDQTAPSVLASGAAYLFTY